MSIGINVNCKHFKKSDLRCKKQKLIFGIFRHMCCEIDFGVECALADRHPRPDIRVYGDSTPPKVAPLIR